MNQQALRKENALFAGTKGTSEGNAGAGFRPAFRDLTTGRVEYARFRNGDVAPVHLIEGLPMEWATRYSADGSVTELRPGIISGFVLNAKFYTREEVLALA